MREQDDLKAHIEAEGDSLKDNFEEIKDRFKEAVDVNVWYRNNTAMAIGGAAAGGFLLSMLLSRRANPRRYYLNGDEVDFLDQPANDGYSSQAEPSHSEPNHEPSQVRRVLGNSLTAIAGVAEDRVQDFLSALVPGFREHYDKARREF